MPMLERGQLSGTEEEIRRGLIDWLRFLARQPNGQPLTLSSTQAADLTITLTRVLVQE